MSGFRGQLRSGLGGVRKPDFNPARFLGGVRAELLGMSACFPSTATFSKSAPIRAEFERTCPCRDVKRAGSGGLRSDARSLRGRSWIGGVGISQRARPRKHMCKGGIHL